MIRVKFIIYFRKIFFNEVVIYNRMSILEKFKKEADSAVNEYMKRLEENEEGDTDFGDSSPQIKQLVTEMSNA